MKKRYIHLLIFLSFTIMFSPFVLLAQKSKKGNTIKVESVVKDGNGLPLSGALIYGNEGAVIAKTDAMGNFTISIPERSSLLIESEGYESALYKPGEYEYVKEFSLKKSLLFYGEKDVVNVAFGKTKKGDIVNAVTVLNPEDILQYDNIQTIAEALSGRVPGLLGSTNLRGIGNVMFIVDGLPRDISSINLSEVEQITVLKDLNSAVMYGNGAVSGVIQVTTKRGKAYKKQINVSGRYGISIPTSLPKYLNSADYMQYYNEARENDGLAPTNSETTIEAYRSGNPYRYPSVDYYSREYLKEFKPYSRVMTELSGGDEVVKYYSNVGWDQSGSLLNFGAGDQAKNNKFNVRGNVDLKINSWIKSSLDAVAVFNNNKAPVGNYWSSASTLQPHLFAPLIPISLIDPKDVLLNGRKNDINGQYLLGGRSDYLTNPIADGYSGGENENVQRTYSFNNRIDLDLGRLAKGLAFHTNISFDYFMRYDQAINNSYSVYLPTWQPTVDSISALTKYGSDVRSGSQNVGNSFYERRFGFYGMLDYDRSFNNNTHHLSGSLVGYGSKYKAQGDFQGNKNVNLGLRIAYSYKNRYLLNFSSAYINSVKLPEGNNRAFSPTLGVAWVIVQDNNKNSSSSINYLKIKASGGVMNSDAGIGGYFYYDNVYARGGTHTWFDATWSNQATVSSYGANPNLAFEKRNELNIGFEGVFFNHHLSLDGNIFMSEYYDQIIRPQTRYPSYFANFVPYENFESNAYKGAELGVAFNQNCGDFSFVLGLNGLYKESEVVKRDELYADLYQNRTGEPIDARFGLVAEGFFADPADIASHAYQAFGQVKPGDIKYVDQNKDGIVDANDEVRIGRSQPPYSYGINLKINYRRLTLFAKGTGAVGADGYLSDNYYWVDGNDKYSEFILDRWTPATAATATLPRLSSVANPNNFRGSSFWLYKDNYFTLDRMQLTYELPEKIAARLKMKHLNFHLDSSNLFTLSRNKNFRELRIGSEPSYRSFSVGIKTMF